MRERESHPAASVSSVRLERMAGSRGWLEVFKFAVCLSFPTGCMLYFGAPSFYRDHVAHLVPAFTREGQIVTVRSSRANDLILASASRTIQTSSTA